MKRDTNYNGNHAQRFFAARRGHLDPYVTELLNINFVAEVKAMKPGDRRRALTWLGGGNAGKGKERIEQLMCGVLAHMKDAIDNGGDYFMRLQEARSMLSGSSETDASSLRQWLFRKCVAPKLTVPPQKVEWIQSDYTMKELCSLSPLRVDRRTMERACKDMGIKPKRAFKKT